MQTKFGWRTRFWIFSLNTCTDLLIGIFVKSAKTSYRPNTESESDGPATKNPSRNSRNFFTRTNQFPPVTKLESFKIMTTMVISVKNRLSNDIYFSSKLKSLTKLQFRIKLRDLLRKNQKSTFFGFWLSFLILNSELQFLDFNQKIVKKEKFWVFFCFSPTSITILD